MYVLCGFYIRFWYHFNLWDFQVWLRYKLLVNLTCLTQHSRQFPQGWMVITILLSLKIPTVLHTSRHNILTMIISLHLNNKVLNSHVWMFHSHLILKCKNLGLIFLILWTPHWFGRTFEIFFCEMSTNFQSHLYLIRMHKKMLSFCRVQNSSRSLHGRQATDAFGPRLVRGVYFHSDGFYNIL